MNVKLQAALLLLVPYLAPAASLTCASASGDLFPRDTVYTYTSTMRVTNTAAATYPAVSMQVYNGTWVYCLETGCVTNESVSFTDDKNTKYAPPSPYTNFLGRTVLRSPTAVPTGATVSAVYKYRITPPDGSTMRGNFTRNTSALYMADTSPNGNGEPTDIPSTPYTGSVSYQAPDQHDFGDVSSDNPDGKSLILPPPTNGFMLANIGWTGPAGTTMNGRVGDASPTILPPGTATPVDASHGLQVDLHAAPSALPGPVSGSLTLTLTCP